MRVAIIVARIDLAGPIIVIRNLVNSLGVFNDLMVKVFYLDKKVSPQVRMIVPVERFDSQKFRFADYDIVHTSGIRPDLLAFLNRKKIRFHISTLHNLVFEDLTFTYNRFISVIFGNIWLLLLNRADKLVCVSETVKTYYSKWFPESKLEVIYNGIGEIDSFFAPEYDVIQSIGNFHSSGLKVIGFAGILTTRKGIDQVLYLMAAEKNLALVIIGNGKERGNLMHLAGKLKISDRCLFCGFRSNASVYIKYFDFFIMPSMSEGFGLAMIEAIQQKIPVICSDINVFKELYHQDEVTFFKSGDQGSLAEALKIAIETGRKKVEKAYSSYLSKYTANAMAQKYYELYKIA